MPTSSGAVRRLLAALAVAAIGMMAIGGGVSAHESREVGEYELVVGFLNEPAIVEEPNGLSLRVSSGEDPVEGLASTLDAEILFGDERLPLELSASFGDPGHYEAHIIPTELGAYSFRIYGDIEGNQIDETFTGGPDTFSEVEGRNAMTFPNQVETVGNVQSMASDAGDTASTAMLLGIGGLVAGLLGLVLGGMAFMRSAPHSRETEPASGSVPQDASD